LSPSALEAIVKHDGRLEILRCLLDGGSLAVPQLSELTRMSSREVDHYVKLLVTFGLVEEVGGTEGGEPRYAATLDDHPDWVREAVEKRRDRD
jgi:DNA-binding transcriptional ArsR family regulator